MASPIANGKSDTGWVEVSPGRPCHFCDAITGCRVSSQGEAACRQVCTEGAAEKEKDGVKYYRYSAAAVKRFARARMAADVERFLAVLRRDPEAPVEVRIEGISTGRGKPHGAAGYYTDLTKAAADVAEFDWEKRPAAIYVTVNTPVSGTLARSPNQLTEFLPNTTSDTDIARRQWLYVDADPIRPAGVSATDAQLAAAAQLIENCKFLLREEYGFPDPVEGQSGNGHCLLYALDLPNDKESTALVKAALEVINALTGRMRVDANTPPTKIDTSVHNAGRIMRLLGTWNRKGHSTPEQPHRRSRLLVVPDQVVVVPVEKLRELAEAAPGKPAQASTPRANPASNGGAARNGKFESRLKVVEWLTDRGHPPHGTRQTPQGATAYLITCPFDASHQGTDTMVFQFPDGAVGFHCLHDSCAGRDWQAAKDVIGDPDFERHYDPPLRARRAPRPAAPSVASALASAEQRREQSPLPQIQHNRRQLRDVTADALAAAVARNEPPTLFQRAEVLTRLRCRAKDQSPYLEPMVNAAIRGHLARCADWVKVVETKHEIRHEDDAPPKEVVEDLASLPDWPGLPVIDRIAESPTFSAAGQLIDRPGFHADARLWYAPAPGLTVPPVPEAPTQAEIERARHWLLVELFGDFPFVGDASRAHALAALLLPLVRDMIDGPTPLHLLDAPTEGTGKTLLASAIAIVTTGRDVEAVAEAHNDDEWRKRFTATLSEAPTLVLLDNINKTLDSGALAAVLTARVWKDRLLGVSKTLTLPNSAVWLASGNNTRLSRELIRRTLWCRLDSKTEAPWERTEFRHPNLIPWAKEHRGQLLWAALTLCRAWIAAGRPPGSQTLGMFEAWAEVIGGILDVAGVPGLLANAKEFRAQRADAESEWKAFVAAWWEKYRNLPVGVAKLFALATEQLLLDSVLGDRGERSQRSLLGRALLKAADRLVGGFQISRAGTDHRNCQLYRLDKVTDAQERGDAWEPPADGPDAESC